MDKLTEIISLPSQGKFYSKDNPLSSGKIELEYMCARHEDILASRNLIENNTAIPKLVSELVVDKKINQDDMLLGDRTAILIAARIMGYGKDYPIKINCTNCSTTQTLNVNLEKLVPKKIREGKLEVTLPITKAVVEFTLPTVKSVREIEEELENLSRIVGTEVKPEVTTRLRKYITSVNGDSAPSTISKFVNSLPARDSAAFRDNLAEVTPDVDMTTPFTCSVCKHSEPVEVAIGPTFFWPNARV